VFVDCIEHSYEQKLENCSQLFKITKRVQNSNGYLCFHNQRH